MKLLLAEDDDVICELIRLVAVEAGYEYLESHDGLQALEMYRAEKPDLVILDVIMPRLTGFEVCEAIRKTDMVTPILLLTAKGDIADKKIGYKTGADDYMTKPFSSEELMLHAEALLRRARMSSGSSHLMPRESFSVADFEFDLIKQCVWYRGTRVDFTPKEFHILVLMAAHHGEVFTREDIIRSIWGDEYLDSCIGIPVYIRHIREKIEDDPSHPTHVRTVGHMGYQFN